MTRSHHEVIEIASFIKHNQNTKVKQKEFNTAIVKIVNRMITNEVIS